MYEMGVKKFFIEKPTASSIYQIDMLLEMVEKKKIEFVTGFDGATLVCQKK